MKFYNSIILPIFLTVILISTGCVSDKAPTTKRPGHDQTTFEVYHFEVLKTEKVFDRSSIGIPVAKKYKFRACFANYKNSEKIIDETFKIEGPFSNLSKKTLTDGCLTWIEKIPFNATAQNPKYIPYQWKITAQDSHRGTFVQRMAFYPWSIPDGSEYMEVIDLNQNPEGLNSQPVAQKNEVKVLQSFIFNDNKSIKDKKQFELFFDKANFIIKYVRSHVRKDGKKLKGAEFVIELNTTPYLRSYDKDDREVLIPLEHGSFRIKPYLINSIEDQDDIIKKIALNIDEPAQKASMKAKMLRKNLILKLPFGPPKGNVEIGLRIVHDSPRYKPFDGVWSVGSFANWVGDKSPHVNSDFISNKTKQAKTLSKYIYNRKEDWNWRAKGYEHLGYRISRPEIEFTAVNMDKCESAMQRKINFNVFTCIKDPIHLRGVENTDFEISYIDEKQGHKVKLYSNQNKVSTLWDGCFIWEDSLEHNYYDRAHYKKRKYKISNKALKINSEIHLAINPWDYGFTFGKDASQFKNIPFKPKAGSKRPVLFIKNYKSNFVQQKYFFDDLLNMGILRTYRYQFEPKILRHDNLISGVTNYDRKNRIRDGMFLVRFVLAKNSMDTNGSYDTGDHVDNYVSMNECLKARYSEDSGEELTAKDKAISEECKLKIFEDVNPNRPVKTPVYLDHYDKVVLAQNGVISTTVDFKIDDLRFIGSRNNLFIEMIPLDPKHIVYKKGDQCQIDEQNSKIKFFQHENVNDPNQITQAKDGMVSTAYMGSNPLLPKVVDRILVPTRIKTSDIIVNKDKTIAHELNHSPGRDFLIPKEELKEKAKIENFSKFHKLHFMDLGKPDYQLNHFVEDLNAEISDLKKIKIRNYREFQMAGRKKAKHLAFKTLPQIKPLSVETINDFIQNGIFLESQRKPLDFKNFNTLMCGYWFKKFYPELAPQIDSDYKALKLSTPFNFEFPNNFEYSIPILSKKNNLFGSAQLIKHPYIMCLENAKDFFVIEKKTQSLKLNKDNKAFIHYERGLSQNYNISIHDNKIDTYTWGDSKGVISNIGHGVNFAEIVPVGKLLKHIKHITLSPFQVSSKREDYTVLRRDHQASERTDQSNGAYLIITRTDFSMHLDRYRNCISIKINPDIFSESFPPWWVLEKGKSYNKYMNAGLLLCNPVRDVAQGDKRKGIRESYFYFYQHFNRRSTGMDEDHVKNRPFVGLLRGEAEFAKFREDIGNLLVPESDPREYRINGELKPGDLKNKNIDPLIGISTSFKRFYNKYRVPFYPGIHTEFRNYNEIHQKYMAEQNSGLRYIDLKKDGPVEKAFNILKDEVHDSTFKRNNILK